MGQGGWEREEEERREGTGRDGVQEKSYRGDGFSSVPGDWMA